jgi:branched-chain amino acid transport system ATP-binding protein
LDDKLLITELKNLTTGYIKDVNVLKDVSMKVLRGKITCIIGANGAGKSTVLKALFGYLTARSGSIHFDGKDVTGWRPQLAIRRGIAYVAQGRCNFPNMSVRENIEVGGYTRWDDQLDEDIDAMMDRFPILRDKVHDMAGNLSGGQQQILEMAMGLINRPQLLLIDEPTLGLSPKLFNEVFHHIIRIKEEGVSVLMVEQNAAQALEIADYAFVLRLGENWMEGPAQEILHNPTVREHYLGGEPGSA